MRHHSRLQCHLPVTIKCILGPAPKQFVGGAQKILRKQKKIFFGGAHFVNSIDRCFIKNHNDSLESRYKKGDFSAAYS